jgi:hypothetical protein
MRLTSLLFLALASSSLLASTATPTAAKLLPPDTVALFSVPNWELAATRFTESPQGQLWRDPATKPLRDKLLGQVQQEFAAPLQRGLGVNISDFSGLLRGEVTLALTADQWGKKPGGRPGVLLIADTGNKQEELKSRIGELRRKWEESGRKITSKTIRDLELTTIFISSETGTANESSSQSRQTEITIGQSGSLLLISNSTREIENVISRLSGVAGPTLAEQQLYEASNSRLFADSLAFAWVNFSPVYQNLITQAGAAGQNTGAGLLAFSPEKLLAATGLADLRTIAARFTTDAEGTHGEVFLNVPASTRHGLLRILTTQNKDAAPPPFISTDTIKFSRYRIDGSQAWGTIENMVARISPQISSLLNLLLQSAGKEKDPDFDLSKALFGNMGDDFISWRRKPRPAKPGQAQSPSKLLLAASPNTEQFMKGLHAATAILPLIADEPAVTQREFLGKRIYSVVVPSAPDLDNASASGPPQISFGFTAAGGYAALSGDTWILEEYIRNSGASAKPLRDLPGLKDAAQKVGGMNTGFFGYDNHAESVRSWIESAKNQSGSLDRLRALSPRPELGGVAEAADDWFDPALLPAFDQVSKYFNFMVYSLSSTEEGLSWRMYIPNPPAFRE